MSSGHLIDHVGREIFGDLGTRKLDRRGFGVLGDRRVERDLGLGARGEISRSPVKAGAARVILDLFKHGIAAWAQILGLDQGEVGRRVFLFHTAGRERQSRHENCPSHATSPRF